MASWRQVADETHAAPRFVTRTGDSGKTQITRVPDGGRRVDRRFVTWRHSCGALAVNEGGDPGKCLKCHQGG